jgi:hypothetical protein
MTRTRSNVQGQAYLSLIGGTMGPTFESTHSLPAGLLVQLLTDGVKDDRTARAGTLCCTLTVMRLCQHEPLHTAPLLGFRGYVLRCIQDALNDAERRVSDHTALAIVCMAMLDLTLGYAKLHEIHKHGLAQLRAVRGGSLGYGFDQVVRWAAELKPAHMVHAHAVSGLEES